MDAVKEVYGMDKFHIHKRVMDAELNSSPAFWTMKQRASCSLNYFWAVLQFYNHLKYGTYCQFLISSFYFSRFIGSPRSMALILM
jgi:hypothetical protein